ncbi:putative RNA recognition motif protein [Monocercomonoides exilis]|uniref:putative RNA recognition motif protein n=1 Tax=Monocercomonoides exilis TaxID=2049356 RepID=UPI003559AE7D|nr:putative RNA recognition motif protein [Monocercomonoides exilis]|eukprot:MONOS_10544.1-p1 / transcript=MONOS_10544.1 / gene=MONOS_10544 / organism=Monocercomonoides_exilis_PA203 / gene_product=unspecified product / transcript_product=unspecified product / location=Mono_scaffold00483:37757-38763(-) / protein_length=305 / sequence_SO=supercontig / SO=protein_coding / is_pseudo=false
MSSTLYIGNLSKDTSAETIGKLFEQVGIVKKASIAMNGTVSRGYGYITMEDHEKAKEAFEKFSGAEVDGREIVVEFYTEEQEQQEAEKKEDSSSTQPFTARYTPRGPFGLPRRGGPRRGGRGYGWPRRDRSYGKDSSEYQGEAGEGESKKDSETKVPSKTVAYIHNLPLKMTREGLSYVLREYRIKDIYLPPQRGDVFLNAGHGFIEMVDEEELDKMLRERPSVSIKGSECHMRRAVDPPNDEEKRRERQRLLSSVKKRRDDKRRGRGRDDDDDDDDYDDAGIEDYGVHYGGGYGVPMPVYVVYH